MSLATYRTLNEDNNLYHEGNDLYHNGIYIHESQLQLK